MNVDEQFESLKSQFVDEVLKRMSPDSRHKWFYVCMGWAMGKGLGENTAITFCRYMKY